MSRNYTITAYVDTNRQTRILTRFLSMLILSFSLIGCASKPVVEYRVADVPEPPKIQRPVLDSVNINSNMDPGTIIQTFRTDIKRLQATIKEYEAVLDSYRKDKK